MDSNHRIRPGPAPDPRVPRHPSRRTRATQVNTGRMTIKLSSTRKKVTEVDITPDRSIIPKLGKGGYTLAQALGELVDNSIEAAIPGQPLRVDLGRTNNTIKITDNGRGMTKDELAAELRLAYRPNNKKTGVGKFGIGPKAFG